MKALQHMEMIDDEADMFGIRQVSILKTEFYISPRFVRIVDAALAEDYSLWTLPALAFFRQPKMQLLEVLGHSGPRFLSWGLRDALDKKHIFWGNFILIFSVFLIERIP